MKYESELSPPETSDEAWTLNMSPFGDSSAGGELDVDDNEGHLFAGDVEGRRFSYTFESISIFSSFLSSSSSNSLIFDSACRILSSKDSVLERERSQ